jgi:hypothetical protein
MHNIGLYLISELDSVENTITIQLYRPISCPININDGLIKNESDFILNILFHPFPGAATGRVNHPVNLCKYVPWSHICVLDRCNTYQKCCSSKNWKLVGLN